MQVFKFGGASIQSAEAVRKAANIIQIHEGTPLVVVISAMGKTTCALEAILQKKMDNQPYKEEIQQRYFYHQNIARSLLVKLKQKVHHELIQWQEQLIKVLSPTLIPHLFDKLYDKFVAHGELIASKIIYYYLKEQEIPCEWVDARRYIRTNSKFRNAQVDWKTTHDLVRSAFPPLLQQKKVVITQGFIGRDENRQTTTLGKEGSDFTGAIVAAILEATSLTIWKDVPGIMNADPKEFDNTIRFDQVSYKEMAEMAFYGAKVVHPKTIQPLGSKDIPL
ncbi:MAG: aspartate kinase, partial [Cytophagales bacterium]|nr:aspartate kinase [Cytophagales bacterium]